LFDVQQSSFYIKLVMQLSKNPSNSFFYLCIMQILSNSCLNLLDWDAVNPKKKYLCFFYSGAAVGGQGMSEADRKVCMVEDIENLSQLAEAYARARGM